MMIGETGSGAGPSRAPLLTRIRLPAEPERGFPVLLDPEGIHGHRQGRRIQILLLRVILIGTPNCFGKRARNVTISLDNLRNLRIVWQSTPIA